MILTYAQTLRLLNQSTRDPISATDRRATIQETYPMRNALLYERLFKLFQKKPSPQNVLLFGPGVIKPTDDRPVMSPAILETIAMSGENPFFLTIVDCDRNLLQQIDSLHCLEYYIMGDTPGLRSSPYRNQIVSALCTILQDTTPEQLIDFDNGNDQGGRVFLVRKNFLQEVTIETVAGRFQELHYGLGQVDICIGMMSLVYALQALSNNSERLDLLAKICHALTKGGRFLMARSELNAFIGKDYYHLPCNNEIRQLLKMIRTGLLEQHEVDISIQYAKRWVTVPEEQRIGDETGFYLGIFELIKRPENTT